MDTPGITALSGMVGSVLGVLATVAMAWITQKTHNQHELLREEIHKRQALYGEFIGECARLLVDAFQHTLENSETLLPAYALLNRIRLCASHEVLAAAEDVVGRITDQYFSVNRSVQELRELAHSAEADPLKAFGEACRAEFKTLGEHTSKPATRQPRMRPSLDACDGHRSPTERRHFPDHSDTVVSYAQIQSTFTREDIMALHLSVPYRPRSGWLRPVARADVLTRVIAATLSASLVLGLGGCATPMLESTVTVPDQFAAAAATEAASEVAWWETYEDPVLSDLIRRAARENRDIKIAAERVRAARAGETISRSSLLPSFGAVGSRGNQGTDYTGRAKQAVPDMETASGGLSVSWEVDLSGRLRAGAAAAAADRMATEDQARGVRLLVLSDVATNYFTLVGALQQLETVRAISAAQDETLRLVTARQSVGLASNFDVERARTDAASARAAIPPLETLAAASRHRIAVLIGSSSRRCGDGEALDRHRDRSGRQARTAGRAPRTPPGSARIAGAAGSGQLSPSAGRGGVVPTAVCRRIVRSPERTGERARPRGCALHQRFQPVDDADLRLGTDALDQRDRRQ